MIKEIELFEEEVMNLRYEVVLIELRYTVTPYKYTLGLEYIASYLQSKEIPCRNFVFEAQLIDSVVNEIVKYRPKIIGIHFYREAESTIFSIARKIKQLDDQIKIVVGGHTASLFAYSILEKEPCIDIVSFGEGEKTFEELWKIISSNGELDKCKGIFYRKNNYIMKNSERELIENLDELPYPALDILKDEASGSNAIFAAISTSRGCLGNCRFCISNRVFDNPNRKRWRGRTPENIIGEILRLKMSFPNKRISYRIVDGSIEDPNPQNKERLYSLISLYEENEIRIPFEVLTRAESWEKKDIPLIKRMVRVGLYAVDIGFEASTERSLRLFNKKSQMEDNYRAYRIFKECGVEVFGFIIMFHPYTTFEELRDNAEFLLEVDMAYQPQSWWAELFLWPDSKILSQIVKDGLLLGFEDKGYRMKYGFVDGKVERAYHFMKKVSELEGTQAYWEAVEKVKIECILYYKWKENDSSLNVIEDIMNAYKNIYLCCREKSGVAQYNLFNKMLIHIENNTLREEELLKEWEENLEYWTNVLEEEWLKVKVKQGRNGIRLL